MKFVKKGYILGVIAFVTGYVLMSFEMAASRILAPTIGSSTYVWTSVIGVIIAALSVGYWLGGKVADKRNNSFDVCVLLLAASFLILLSGAISNEFLKILSQSMIDERLKGVLAALVLYAPASFMLGTISPYLAKLNVKSLSSSAKSYANLSALNSIGGITGTFLTGFWLFSQFGSMAIASGVGLLLALSSLLIQPKKYLPLRLLILASLILLAFLKLPQHGQVSIDTASARYVVQTKETHHGVYRYLKTGPYGTQSGGNLNKPDELVFWYTQEIVSQIDRIPNKDSILILGGGAYTMPNLLSKKYPNSKIDVAEIDPDLKDISREYFNYKPGANVTEIDSDARIFVDSAEKKYDIIVVDVFGDTAVPFSLMTSQYGRSIKKITKQNGVVLVNVIGGRVGDCKRQLEAVVAPFKENYKSLSIKYSDNDIKPGNMNMIVTASDNQTNFEGYKKLEVESPAFTDDYAPIEPINRACLKETVDEAIRLQNIKI